MRRLFLQALWLVAGLVAAAFTVLAALRLFIGGCDPLRKLWQIVEIPLFGAGTLYLLGRMRRVPATKQPLIAFALERLDGLSDLRRLYLELRLASHPGGLVSPSYASASNSDLLGVAENINPTLAPERAAELFNAIKQRVEAAYLPDGRLLPSALRAAERVVPPEGTLCAAHPTDAAAAVSSGAADSAAPNV